MIVLAEILLQTIDRMDRSMLSVPFHLERPHGKFYAGMIGIPRAAVYLTALPEEPREWGV